MDGASLWMGGYISQTESGVLMFDTADLSLRGSAVTGSGSPAVALVGNSLSVLVAQHLTLLNATTLSLQATIELPSTGVALSLRPDGRLPIPADAEVMAVDTRTRKLATRIAVQSLFNDIAVAARGRGDERRRQHGVVGRRRAHPCRRHGARPRDEEASAVGSRLAVDLARRALAVDRRWLHEPPDHAGGQQHRFQPQLRGIAFTPDGSRAWVTGTDGSVAVFDATTRVQVDTSMMPGIGGAAYDRQMRASSVTR